MDEFLKQLSDAVFAIVFISVGFTIGLASRCASESGVKMYQNKCFEAVQDLPSKEARKKCL